MKGRWRLSWAILSHRGRDRFPHENFNLGRVRICGQPSGSPLLGVPRRHRDRRPGQFGAPGQRNQPAVAQAPRSAIGARRPAHGQRRGCAARRGLGDRCCGAAQRPGRARWQNQRAPVARAQPAQHHESARVLPKLAGGLYPRQHQPRILHSRAGAVAPGCGLVKIRSGCGARAASRSQCGGSDGGFQHGGADLALRRNQAGLRAARPGI